MHHVPEGWELMTLTDTKVSTNRMGSYYKEALSGHREEELTIYAVHAIETVFSFTGVASTSMG